VPKIIDECCELVKLRHINRRGPFFETQWYRIPVDAIIDGHATIAATRCDNRL